jgi:hypothetical protein
MAVLLPGAVPAPRRSHPPGLLTVMGSCGLRPWGRSGLPRPNQNADPLPALACHSTPTHAGGGARQNVCRRRGDLRGDLAPLVGVLDMGAVLLGALGYSAAALLYRRWLADVPALAVSAPRIRSIWLDRVLGADASAGLRDPADLPGPPRPALHLSCESTSIAALCRNSRSVCEFGDHLFGEQVDAGTVIGRVSEVADRIAETKVAGPRKPLGDLLGGADQPLGLELRQLRL